MSSPAPTRESPRAAQAWADYLALGPDRSLQKLAAAYQERGQSGGKAGVPTLRLSTLEQWSVAFGWQARLLAIAEREARDAEEREAAYRRDIMETGFALAHERVKALKSLADALLGDLTADGEGSRRWVADVKGIGAGDNWQEVKVERFNSQEVEQLRGILDDLAKETSGRPRTVKVDIEHRVRVLAEELGLDPDQAVAEAARVIREARRAAPG